MTFKSLKKFINLIFIYQTNQKMFPHRQKLTLKDLQDLKISVEAAMLANQPINEIHELTNANHDRCLNLGETYEAEFQKKVKIIDNLASILNGVIEDIWGLIEREQSAREQNTELTKNMEHLQSDYMSLRDENDMLKQEVIQSAFSLQKLHEQKQRMEENNAKIRQEFIEMNQFFSQQNSRLKDQLSAINKSELDQPPLKYLQHCSQQEIKILSAEVQFLRELLEKQKERNSLLTKELQLSQISLKELLERMKKYPQKDMNKIKSELQESLSSNHSHLLERNNLKFDLDAQSSVFHQFNSSRLQYSLQNSSISKKNGNESLQNISGKTEENPQPSSNESKKQNQINLSNESSNHRSSKSPGQGKSKEISFVPLLSQESKIKSSTQNTLTRNQSNEPCPRDFAVGKKYAKKSWIQQFQNYGLKANKRKEQTKNQNSRSKFMVSPRNHEGKSRFENVVVSKNKMQNKIKRCLSPNA